MPSLQEMLVSYAVKIDESGVSRLHTLLDQNRKKAADTAAAFDRAEKSITSFGKTLTDLMKRFPQGGSLMNGFLPGTSYTRDIPTEQFISPETNSSDTGQRTRELSRFASVLSESIRSSVSAVTIRSNTYTAGGTGSFALNADTSAVQEAIDDLTRFIASKAPTMRMKGDASGLITAASNAAGRVKSILSDVKVDIGGSNPGSSSGSGHSSSPGFSSPSAPVMQFSSVGGRFDSPTTTQVAEDGDTEYIIPVRKEKKAVPLIMQMMGDLSFNAYQSVLSQLGVQHLQTDSFTSAASSFGGGGRRPEGVVGLNPVPSLSSFASGLSIQNHYDISAPCTIQVHSTGTDAKQVGEAAYNAAERQLLRSIRGVMK